MTEKEKKNPTNREIAIEEAPKDKKRVIAWIKDHRKQLILTDDPGGAWRGLVSH